MRHTVYTVTYSTPGCRYSACKLINTATDITQPMDQILSVFTPCVSPRGVLPVSPATEAISCTPEKRRGEGSWTALERRNPIPPQDIFSIAVLMMVMESAVRSGFQLHNTCISLMSDYWLYRY